MFDWQINITSEKGTETTLSLLENTTVQVNETDAVVFTVTVAATDHWQTVEILLQDELISLYQYHRDADKVMYKSIHTSDINRNSWLKNKIFYNQFGQSQLSLNLKNSQKSQSYQAHCDVLARPLNAKKVKTLLHYLGDNMDMIVKFCYSHNGKVPEELAKKNSLSFKLQLLTDVLDYLHSKRYRFKKNHKFSWQEVLTQEPDGMPSGPESIYWVQQHIDHLVPVKPEIANIRLQGRTYKINPAPSERLIENTDLYENRVILGFLKSAQVFVNNTRNDGYFIKKTVQQSAKQEEFTHFSQMMNQLKVPLLNQHVKQLENCQQRLIETKHWLINSLNAKAIVGLPPKITPFVQKHPHYHQLFKHIFNWYNQKEPNIKDNLDVLFRSKNLAELYEFTCLIQLLKSIEQQQFKLINNFHLKHDPKFGFGGKPEYIENKVNNYYLLTKKGIKAELYYEPEIYALSVHSKTGDLIRTRGHNIKLPYKPDFLLKLTFAQYNNEPIIIIFDSKYSTSENVKNFYLNDLVEKYLLNLHQHQQPLFSKNNIQGVYALFAHNSTGEQVDYYPPKHQITGQAPVFPLIGGIYLEPDHRQHLDKLLLQLMQMCDVTFENN